jgi:hypothetical protein
MSADPTPTDPRLAALLVRIRRIRVELDRLDDGLDLLDCDGRVDLLDRAIALREAVDQLDAGLERVAAGTDT